MRRLRLPRLGKRLEWTAGGSHPFEFELRLPRWPPFFATALFEPRIRLSITNAGSALPRTTFGLYITEYSGPPGDIPSIGDGWVDTDHKEIHGNWQPGEKRRLRFTVRSRNLPHDGTYALKLLVTKMVPLGTLYEQTLELANADDLPKETREALLRSSQEEWERRGIDPHKPQPHASGGEEIHRIFVIDYFRVEALSNVLTFGLVIATLLLAVGTLVLALRA
jgi:hypothetical protein